MKITPGSTDNCDKVWEEWYHTPFLNTLFSLFGISVISSRLQTGFWWRFPARCHTRWVKGDQPEQTAPPSARLSASSSCTIDGSCSCIYTSHGNGPWIVGCQYIDSFPGQFHVSSPDHTWTGSGLRPDWPISWNRGWLLPIKCGTPMGGEESIMVTAWGLQTSTLCQTSGKLYVHSLYYSSHPLTSHLQFHWTVDWCFGIILPFLVLKIAHVPCGGGKIVNGSRVLSHTACYIWDWQYVLET